jgi:C4-dicarboxylate transporter, DctM subunit
MNQQRFTIAGRLMERVASFGVQVAGVACLIMGLFVVFTVISRMAGAPISGSIEVVAFVFMPVVAMLPLANVHLREEHIAVTGIVNSAPEPVRARLAVLVEVVLLAMAAGVAIQVFSASSHQYSIGARATVATWLPLWGPYLIVALSWAMLVLAATVRIARLLAAGGEYPPPVSGERKDALEGSKSGGFGS